MVHPPLSYGAVHSSFSEGFRCMATKPTLVLPWSPCGQVWSSVFSSSWTRTLGRLLGNRIKVSACCAGGLGEHRCDSEVLTHREGPCVRHWVTEILQDGAYCPHCVAREAVFLPTDHISLSPTAASYTSLPQLCLIFPTVLGESAAAYANVRLSFINIYAGKHICSSVCTAGALLLRQSVVSSGESKNLC